MKLLMSLYTAAAALWAIVYLPSPIQHSLQAIGQHAKPDSEPLSWSIPPLETVVMRFIHNSSYFAPNGTGWRYQLPPGGHTIHLAPDETDYEDKNEFRTLTVTLFHQLRCLEIIQDAYIHESKHRTSPLVSHCMNYIRENVLCMCNMHNGPRWGNHIRAGYDQWCNDWEPIYQEATRNFEIYSRMKD